MDPTDPTPETDSFDDDWREPPLQPDSSVAGAPPDRSVAEPQDQTGSSSGIFDAKPPVEPGAAPEAKPPVASGIFDAKPPVEPVATPAEVTPAPVAMPQEPVPPAPVATTSAASAAPTAPPESADPWPAAAAASQPSSFIDEPDEAEFDQAASKFFDEEPTPAGKARSPLQVGAIALGVLALIAVVGFVGSRIVSSDDPDTQATDSTAESDVAEDTVATDEAAETDSTSEATEGDADTGDDVDATADEATTDDAGPVAPGLDSVLGVAPEGRGWEYQAAPGIVPAGIEGPAVEVSPGDDVAAIVADAPANAVFRFAAGVYQDVQLVPRDGDSYLGFGQAVLDGSTAGDGSAAFTGAAKDVTISGFEVRNYGNVSQNGAINAQIGGSDNPPAEHRSRSWVLEDLNVHGNNGVGINIGPFGTVRRVRLHSNGQLGITSHGGRGILVEDCEVDNNNTQKVDPGFEGGGSKFKYTFDLVVRNCYFHDNYGYGLWTDIDNFNTLFEDNLIENETWSCISHEVSFDAVIRNNTVRNCGTDGDPWLWKAGIQVANSPDVVVEDNIVENSYNGIGLIAQDRGDPRWVLENVVVRNNTIVDSGQSGVVTDTLDDDGNPTRPADTITFENNVWDAGLPDFEGELELEVDTERSRRTADFRWGTIQSDWQGWQALGLDADGSFVDR